MNNLDDETLQILDDYRVYNKTVLPRPSLWIALACMPLGIFLFQWFLHFYFKAPYRPWEDYVGLFIQASIQISILGWMVKDVFFTRHKSITEIMRDEILLEREYFSKLRSRSLEAIKEFLDYLHSYLNFREKSIGIYIGITVTLISLLLALGGWATQPNKKYFAVFSTVSVVISIILIHSQKSIHVLRRFEELLHKVLASGGGPERVPGSAA